jgi:hypothetical protein
MQKVEGSSPFVCLVQALPRRVEGGVAEWPQAEVALLVNAKYAT